jgi:AraC-like DNA-binding protein
MGICSFPASYLFDCRWEWTDETYFCVFMISWNVRLNSPSGRLSCGVGWSRTRENSLMLRDLELWFVWRGRGWMRTKDRELPLWPGFCALMRPGGIYDAGHDETEPLGIVFLHFDILQGSRPAPAGVVAGWPEFFDLADVTYWDAITRRLVQLAAQDPPTAEALLQGALTDLLKCPSLDDAGGRQAPSGHERRISEIAARLSLETSDLPAVAELAKEAGLGAAHFSRVFRRFTGQSPKGFLLRARLTRAQHLLRETAMTVTEIADRLGYSDVFFFSRQFKQKTGLSPLAYRSHRSGAPNPGAPANRSGAGVGNLGRLRAG